MGMVEKNSERQQLTTLSIPLYQWMAVFPQPFLGWVMKTMLLQKHFILLL